MNYTQSIALCTVGFHYTDFIWAVSSVMSRVNKIPIVGTTDYTLSLAFTTLTLYGQCHSLSRVNKIPIVGTTDYTLSLVPYWDMANHTRNG